MSQLSNLSELVKKRKRIGRGKHRGGTSTKGHKGQKARSGALLGVIFEGGQMPLTRRLPKRGFSNALFKKQYEVVNVDRLEVSFESGATINKETLLERNIIKNKNSLVKILGSGVLAKKFIVYANAFSKSAAEAIATKGGEVHII